MKRAMIIAAKGKAQADIVVGKSPSATAEHAATELAAFLKQATGAVFRVNRRPGKSLYHIVIGQQAALAVDPDLELENAGLEDVVMKTSGRNIVLSGGEPRGTLYAVYSFLHEVAGCRWWTSDESTIPQIKTFAVPPLDTRYVPPLEYRYSYWTCTSDPDWAVRNLSNGQSELCSPEYGGNMTHGGVHTFYTLISPQRYFKKHPEWFSLIKRRRTHENGQLCLTNDNMFKQLVRNLKGTISRNPAQKVFSVSQNDWHGNCECSRCRAMDRKFGGPAGTMLYFVNRVAEAVEKTYPEVSISTLAYTYTRKAPEGIRPRHNVIVQLCNIECCFTHPLTAKCNRAFRDDMVAWSRMADRIYIWDYVANYSNYFMPFANLRVLGDNIRFFVKHNVRGIFEQGVYNEVVSEFSELRAWVLARLLWDPSLDERSLIAEFCKGFYGAASGHILEYIGILHDAVQSPKYYLKCYSGPIKEYFSFDVLNRCMRKLDVARRAVKGDVVLENRVDLLRICVMYAFLWDWNALRKQCSLAHGKWPLTEDIREVAREFKHVLKANGVNRIHETKSGISRIDKAVDKALGSEKEAK